MSVDTVTTFLSTLKLRIKLTILFSLSLLIMAYYG